jgi:DNA polymerase I-like protein with 3'-5' exonuclease and polymerase domains
VDFDITEWSEQIGRPTITKKSWMESKKLVLATADMLPKIIDDCIASGLYALDLETTGLDNRVFNGATVDRIAGACISPDGEVGYYIPVSHPDHMDSCVSFSLFTREMRRLVASPAVAIFHNGKFDQEFLQFNGGEAIGEWDDPKKWEDTLILAYLRNSRQRAKGLKFLAKTELGMEMIELDELFGDKAKGDLDFGTLDPTWEPAIWYAASDAICTYMLYKHLRSDAVNKTDMLPSQEPIYMIEKLCVTATRWMERCRIPIDRDKVAELIRIGQREWLPALGEVYEEASKALGRDITPGYFRLLIGDNPQYRFDPEDVECGIKENIDRTRAEAARRQPEDGGDPTEPDSKGKPRVKTITKRVLNLVDKKQLDTVEFPLVYDALIPDQLGLLLRELGVEGLIATEKSGQVKTSKDVLDKVIEEAGEEFPYIKKIMRFREVSKAIASNLQPLYESTTKERSPDGRIRVNFNAFTTDTARFSTPADREGRGWTGKTNWNIHSIPSGRKKDIPECLKRIREVIKAPEGKLLYAIDYSGEELRVVTNLSREPLWETEFFRCAGCGHKFDPGATVPPPPEPPPPFCPECGSDSIGDLHTLTAIALYGADVVNSGEFKVKRNSSKGVNFALCYGGGGMAVVRSAGVSKDEGWRIKRQFDATYKGLAGWWERQYEFGRRTGYVLTAFNRRYPVPDITSADGGFRSKAERNAVNGPIQACLHPDCRVPTEDGMLRVEDLWLRAQAGGKAQFKVWTGVKWERARPILSGVKEVVKTTLEDGGYLLTSPRHLFLVWRKGQHEWVRQNELQIGDWVVRDSAPVDFAEPSYHFSDESRLHNATGFTINGNSEILWELLGRIIGDGDISHDGFSISVGEAPDALREEAEQAGYSAEKHARNFAARIEAGLGVRVKVREQKQNGGRPLWIVSIWNKAFRRFCIEVLGLKVATTRTKSFPDAVWSESLKNRAAFLRGYFDADGGITPKLECLLVRSVNQTLLRETYLLLRSIGVRAAHRPKSQMTSVLDRHKYRDIVGSSVEYKSARLHRMVKNAYTEQNTRLAGDLVREIGEVIYKSPGYAGLPRARKSAVLRLRAGSGSKAQCLKLAAECQGVVFSQEIVNALSYDYSRVSVVEAMGEEVTMYDVEVFDDFHAFSCDGVIVHNTGSDIMKWAMGLIYRECKKRKWFDKVKVIVTIHDELLFEIDNDIASEAVDVIVEIMLRKTTEKLAWRVPLTCDIEAGPTWTVPWNITKIRHGKQAMPPELEGVFANLTAVKADITSSGDEGGSEEAASTDAALAVAEPPSAAMSKGTPIPALPKGAEFVYVIRTTDLTMRTQARIASVIHRCRGRGDNILKLVTETGEPLWDGEPIYVNAGEASVLLHMPEH